MRWKYRAAHENGDGTIIFLNKFTIVFDFCEKLEDNIALFSLTP